MAYDVVIKNGTVVDGTGTPPFRADVGIARGRIAEIGRFDAGGAEVIDAEGQVVTPGFIDGHTHMDAQVMWDPLGTCSCWHGVTTVVMGNCGFTLAPARAGERALVVRNLERAEDIAPAALAAGIDWRWETFPEFLDILDELPMGINYAANVGHSALRTWAMGERAFEEEASEDDLRVMLRELNASLRAGAIGFTTTRSGAHATSDGRPVASRLASWGEIRTLVGAMATAGHGIFEVTPGTGLDPELAGWEAEYRRIYDLAIETGVPTTFGLFGSMDACRRILRDVEATAAAGGRVFVQSHSRGIANVLSLKSRLPFDYLPEWRAIRSLPLDAQLAALRDPAQRRLLVEAAKGGDYAGRIGTEPRKPDYEVMTVLDGPLPPNPTVAALATARGVDPAELMVDLVAESNGEQFFVQSLGAMDNDFLVEGMRHPLSIMTFSDSGAHVSQIMDASIQTHLLAYWVRDRHEFTLEQAVHMLTQMPAEAWGFSDRGVLREGMVADINVFDPDRVAPLMPTVEHDLPGGATRLKQRSTGFMATLVAGRVLLRDGEHTGALPGQLLRAGQH